MITLKYRRIEPTAISYFGFYMLEEVLCGAPDVVRIELWAEKNAELSLCGKRIKIKDGGCEIAFADIKGEVVEVDVIANGRSHFATPFLKAEDKILRLPTDEATYLELRAAYLELEKKVDSIENRLTAVEGDIRPRPLFDFN